MAVTAESCDSKKSGVRYLKQWWLGWSFLEPELWQQAAGVAV
jgi:hypothetical protein